MVQQGLRATSKSSLKLQCLFCAKGDLKEAKELYEFFAADMPNLPDNDPVPPTWVDNTRDTVNGVMGWLKENQDTLMQGFEFVRDMIQKRGGVGAALPESTVQSLPPIND